MFHRNCNSRLHKLLGVSDAELTPKLLSTYNINTLQVWFLKHFSLKRMFVKLCMKVIVNDFRERIEQYNGELVQVKEFIKMFICCHCWLSCQASGTSRSQMP